MKLQKEFTRWFEIPDDPDGATIEIKHLAPGEIKSIIQKVSKANPQSPDFIGGAEKVFMKAVVNWKQFTGLEDEQLECTLKNKTLMYDTVTGLEGFVTDCRKELEEEANMGINESEKN